MWTPDDRRRRLELNDDCGVWSGLLQGAIIGLIIKTQFIVLSLYVTVHVVVVEQRYVYFYTIHFTLITNSSLGVGLYMSGVLRSEGGGEGFSPVVSGHRSLDVVWDVCLWNLTGRCNYWLQTLFRRGPLWSTHSVTTSSSDKADWLWRPLTFDPTVNCKHDEAFPVLWEEKLTVGIHLDGLWPLRKLNWSVLEQRGGALGGL